LLARYFRLAISNSIKDLAHGCNDQGKGLSNEDGYRTNRLGKTGPKIWIGIPTEGILSTGDGVTERLWSATPYEAEKAL
jgi:hypothetical protein